MHTMDLTPESLETLHQIEHLVRRHLGPGADSHDVAIGILLESAANNVLHPSRSFIYQRCVDFQRRHSVELRANAEHLTLLNIYPPTQEHDPVVSDQLEQLTSVLDSTERRLVALRFMYELSVTDIARTHKLDPTFIRQTLEGALYKMRRHSEGTSYHVRRQD